MTGKLCSWARKSGKFVNGTQNFSYDNVILYVIEKGTVTEKADTKTVGKPVLFHEVKVPFARWAEVCNGVDADNLDAFINHTCTAFYDMSEYNGRPICRISSVTFD